MKPPLVSVIIPIYNVGSFIDNCIRSVLAQSHDNLELILVNDGSPDDSGAICDGYAESDERINVVHKDNGGVSSARNAGLDVAKGDYILFIDGDDWVDDDHVEYLLSLCVESEALMSMSYGIHASTKIDADDESDTRRCVNGIVMAADLLYHKTVIGSYNKMFKRELIYENGIRFNENLFIGEGFNFIVMAAQLAPFVATGTKKTYYYRLDNTESAMTKFNVKKIRNNDIALDAIRSDFVIQSSRLTIAWNYARWITSLSFSVWMRVAGAQGEYPEDYKKMVRDIRGKAPLVFVANVGLGKKLSAAVALVAPRFMIWALEMKRKN